METQDKLSGWFRKVYQVAVEAYIANIIIPIFALEGRIGWVAKGYAWERDMMAFFYMAFGMIFVDVIIIANMKKLVESGGCKHPVRDCIVVIAPIVLAVLSLILDLILIR